MISELKFIWDAEHNLMIRKIYDHQAVKHFQQLMSDIRKGCDHLTSWIPPAIKKELEAYFTHDEAFKQTNLANRLCPDHRTDLHEDKEQTDREATLAETFKYTLILKANKERFTDERSVAHYEDYTQRLEVATQQSQLPNENDEADSRYKKNSKYHRIYCRT
ncbi:uncharacterized protein LOC107645688 [Arachis ipaensis]|nr:uncharacterized protein LOC107645688 [Arachis ipaensis]XP_020959842.1 uncharacterized protein LOC107645688 [Arachis ipaensis]XP_020959843.1 uncharacterized protein LOC107645688 [Arachis ipaensis]XP_025662941.1 uncharacterized protein LOC112758468 [Arachis hypogaea]XP_025662942.1 uncharacterized protein LOC112758468 [Arachis hypogaea]XP_025662943.1 uncharacterized protein LOC112758468 [Arachis hypogaea]XP_025662944.1 uncharacterized protein LOC112758468 [Arachis hypogaea]